mgnify:CR=1 FL=1
MQKAYSNLKVKDKDNFIPEKSRAKTQSKALKLIPISSSFKQKFSSSIISDYINLTKPGIMVLLLISTICPMFLAFREVGTEINYMLMLYVFVGGALVSGSASVLNCIYDKDIDQIMLRTRQRPLAAGRVRPLSAFIYAILLGAAGVAILALKANPLAAIVSIYGHLFYVIIYTIYLKRSTPQNIVIGGAAGAFPPVVGWAAVTGEITLMPILLFLVVFFWTPPHFWALALNKNEDYRRANIPMMPVIRGDRSTIYQMLVYSFILLPIAVSPAFIINGSFSLTVFSINLILSLYFIYKIVLLARAKDDESKEVAAWSVFGFSLIHLGGFFASLVLGAFI